VNDSNWFRKALTERGTAFPQQGVASRRLPTIRPSTASATGSKTCLPSSTGAGVRITFSISERRLSDAMGLISGSFTDDSSRSATF
jgi:hypothetical protein